MLRMVRTCAVALAFMISATHAMAEWTPPGPIKLMIAFAAGGGADTQARLIAEELEARSGWKFIPQQVTGKGGVNLLKAIKDEPNDGTVIGMLVAESMGYNLYAAKAGMTPADFTPLTTTAGAQMGIVALSSNGWKTINDVIADAKGGKKIRFGVMSPRLADLAYLLGKAQGVEFNIISVKGGRAVMNGVNAGDMDIGFMAGIQAKGVASGDLVNLASAMSTPLKQTPDAPLMEELGVSYDGNAFFMFVGPGGMADDARNALATAIADVASDESTKVGKMIKRAFGGSMTIQGKELEALVKTGYDESPKLLKEASE